MELRNRCILVTGGSSGIGLRLAEELLARGNEVIVCARRSAALVEAKKVHPLLVTLECDVSLPGDRELLFGRIAADYPNLDLLVNNAGIQRRFDLAAGTRDLAEAEKEIAINLTGTVAMCALFVPFLAKRPSAIVNVSSGLAFVPIASMPVYCATKAAIHSFTVSLRHQLRDTSVRVFEAIPPTTDTALDQGRRPAQVRGIPAIDVAKAILTGMEMDIPEIAVGEAAALVEGSRKDPLGFFSRLNGF